MLTIGTNGTVVGEASNATIAKGNIWSCNAVIHEIDTVLLPQSAVDALTGGAPCVHIFFSPLAINLSSSLLSSNSLGLRCS